MRTSYSALETFGICPQKYKFQEIDKIRAPKRIEAVFGTIVHSALKYMFERNPLFPTEDEVVNFFSERFNEKSDAVEWPDASKKERAEKLYYDEGVKLIRNFYAKNKPWDFNPVELEGRFQVEITGDNAIETHTIAGIIDRLDKDPTGDSYEIIDYKTGKKMPSQESLENNLQLALYHLAILKRWPHLKAGQVKTSLYFLKHNEKITAVPNEHRAENAIKIILAKIAEIKKAAETGDFPPVPSALCDWCGFRKICPMWKHIYEEKSETPDESAASNAIKEYFEIKETEEKNDRRLKEIRGIILAYMDSKKIGRVFGSGGYITKMIQERVSFDMEKVKSVLESLGRWAEVLSPDSKKIERLMETLPEETREKLEETEKKKSFIVLKQTKKEE
ncbi:MAG: PD-(D/E)XK nuclease family protein [Patescibacteria group bacterium]